MRSSISLGLARQQDAEQVLALYNAVRYTPGCNWDDEYPGMDNIRKDIADGQLWIACAVYRRLGFTFYDPVREYDLDFYPCEKLL